jgi:hypothetical protein
MFNVQGQNLKLPSLHHDSFRCESFQSSAIRFLNGWNVLNGLNHLNAKSISPSSGNLFTDFDDEKFILAPARA